MNSLLIQLKSVRVPAHDKCDRNFNLNIRLKLAMS